MSDSVKTGSNYYSKGKQDRKLMYFMYKPSNMYTVQGDN